MSLVVRVVMSDRLLPRGRIAAAADQWSDDEGGEEEHRHEHDESDPWNPPVSDASPELEEHRRGGGEAEDAEQRGAPRAGDQCGSDERADVAENVGGHAVWSRD